MKRKIKIFVEHISHFHILLDSPDRVTSIKLFEIELFVDLTVCKQMTDVWLNC